MPYFAYIIIIACIIILFSCVRILKEYERGVIFTLGRYTSVKGPGFFLIIPFIQQMDVISLRTMVMDVPPQYVISKDNVSVQVNAVVYFKVISPELSIIQVEDYMQAISQLSQTTLRSVLGQHELDDMLSKREKLNADLQRILDDHTDTWGIKVLNVEIKDVDLNESMIRAIAKQAEAERERRAKIINAEGELQASDKLSQAAHVLAKEPVSIQLRYLQSMIDVAGDKTHTIVFPLPMDLLNGFQQLLERNNQKN